MCSRVKVLLMSKSNFQMSWIIGQRFFPHSTNRTFLPRIIGILGFFDLAMGILFKIRTIEVWFEQSPPDMPPKRA